MKNTLWVIGVFYLFTCNGQEERHHAAQGGAVEYYTKLAGIISPYLEFKGRGQITGEETVRLSHYEFTYGPQGELRSIRFFEENEPGNNSYYGTHEVRYTYGTGQRVRTYYDANGNKATTYRHYYSGGNIHKEVFTTDDGDRTSLVFLDTLGDQVATGMGTYRMEFQRCNERHFIQEQFKKDGTPNILTTYFPLYRTEIRTNESGFLRSIVNLDKNGAVAKSEQAGYARVVFDFDAYGNELGWSFHGIDNNLSDRKAAFDMDFGFAKVVYEFQWKDKKLGLHHGFKEFYYDEQNEPVENNRGVHRIAYVYDDHGNFLRSVAYDLGGREVE
ncbi:hypothetical protein [Robertkochia sediminum]|uniref:hypothetical protein n=1 Tax=Robertkochia sediminum TaxID=2785326 RepID=UPI001932F462|nr:hypothetical protein [Robertkochia sediminum]MBL7472041.1 hypothetical protein [Robertkochia sediminum]